ncbi:MAG: PQQ-dependent sugar dehydrogenase, partial [Archangium sp.]
MRAAPFDVPRALTVPQGFSIAVLARVPGARFMAVTPEGNLLVSNPGAGTVSLVRPGAGGADAVVSDWVTGLRKPHDLVFH